MRRLVSCTLVVALAFPVSTFAAPPPRPPPPPPPAVDLPPPPPPPPPAVECFPACRGGYFCYQGECRSACNPPCAPGEQCLANGQCVNDLGAPPADAPLAGAEGGRPASGTLVNSDGERAPAGFHFETQRRKGMLISGVVLFGVGWILSGLYGVFASLFAGATIGSSNTFAFYNRNTYLLYVVPVVGPAISQFALATSYGYRGTYREPEYLVAAVFTGLQVTGLLLALLGLKSREVLVEDRRASAAQPPPVRWSLAPGAPGTPFGLSLLVEN